VDTRIFTLTRHSDRQKKESLLHNSYKATDGWDMSGIKHQAGQHNNANEKCN